MRLKIRLIPAIIALTVLSAIPDNSYSQWRGNVYGIYGFDDMTGACADDRQYFQGDISGAL